MNVILLVCLSVIGFFILFAVFVVIFFSVIFKKKNLGHVDN